MAGVDLTLGMLLCHRRLPASLLRVAQRQGVRHTRHVLVVSVRRQRMQLFESAQQRAQSLAKPAPARPAFLDYRFVREYLVSTSAFGIGQCQDSNQTPLGLHRVAQKVGAGHLIGTIFKGRKAVGLTWEGIQDASIVHRILWLEGLEPGFNRGGNVDSFGRYIYIHGFGDETTLGKPESHGCIHLAAADLLPLFDRLPVGTLVWIDEN